MRASVSMMNRRHRLGARTHFSNANALRIRTIIPRPTICNLMFHRGTVLPITFRTIHLGPPINVAVYMGSDGSRKNGPGPWECIL